MFDRRLSLAVDAIHDELDRLADLRGWRVTWRRAFLRWKLRQLEKKINND